MINKSILTVVLFSITTLCISQTNQLDSDGRKNGKYTIYLDKNWRKTKDSTKAIFYRYTYFIHGTNIYPNAYGGLKNYKLEGDTTNKILNGEYKWYDGDGKLRSVHVLINGEYVSCKVYYKNGNLYQYFDYTKKGDNQEHGWTLYNYDKEGNLNYSFVYAPNEEGYWPRTRD